MRSLCTCMILINVLIAPCIFNFCVSCAKTRYICAARNEKSNLYVQMDRCYTFCAPLYLAIFPINASTDKRQISRDGLFNERFAAEVCDWPRNKGAGSEHRNKMIVSASKQRSRAGKRALRDFLLAKQQRQIGVAAFSLQHRAKTINWLCRDF